MSIFSKIFNPSAKGKLWQVFFLIIVLAIVGLVIDFPGYYNRATGYVENKTSIDLPEVGEIPFHLGLDLQGGTHLVYEADVSQVPEKDKASAVEGVRDVIERRVNVFGVSEPNILTNHTSDGQYRIIAELAGIKDVSEAIKMIGETPLLEFKEKGDANRELTEEEKNTLNEINSKAEEDSQEVLGKLLSGGDFEALAREYSQDPDTAEAGGDLGWVQESDRPEVVAIAKELQTGEMTKEVKDVSYGKVLVKLEEKRIKADPFSGEEEKEVKASHILICYEGSESCDSGLTKDEAYAQIKQLKEEATPNNFADLAKKHSTGPSGPSGGELGWFGRGQMLEPFEETVFDQEIGTISYVVETKFGYHLILKEDERPVNEYHVRYILFRTISKEDILNSENNWENTELTGKFLERSSVQFNPNDGSPEVALEFDSEGADLFAQITERNIGEEVAIFLDGYPISVPTVNSKITGGKAVISGTFSLSEAKLLAQRLNAGALPVPIKLVSQKTVGASLGQESVRSSLEAGIVGLILVALFMILFYRFSGLLAVVSLAIYGLLVLAVFKIWSVTLTLSGLAGFILSIGMAVDANVLIFERIKEELKKAKPLGIAIDEGFNRAWPSIRDGNISTLITCVILIMFFQGMVQGFAITLLIGILVSMFSAIVITKNFLSVLSGDWLEKRKWLLGAKNNK